MYTITLCIQRNIHSFMFTFRGKVRAVIWILLYDIKKVSILLGFLLQWNSFHKDMIWKYWHCIFMIRIMKLSYLTATIVVSFSSAGLKCWTVKLQIENYIWVFLRCTSPWENMQSFIWELRFLADFSTFVFPIQFIYK